jgi:hypothetical protein
VSRDVELETELVTMDDGSSYARCRGAQEMERGRCGVSCALQDNETRRHCNLGLW